MEHELTVPATDASGAPEAARPPQPSADGWVAADAPADVGLAGLRAHLERLVARHDLRSLTVVVDDTDLGRQAFRAGAGSIPPGLAAAGTGAHADPALPSDALDTELLVALCAASLRVDVLRGTPDPTGELALRRLPGVYAVQVERDDDLLVVRVHVDETAPDDLGRVAARALTPEPGVRLVVELVHGEPGTRSVPGVPTDAASSEAADRPAAAGPTLLAIRSVPEAGEIEAHVAVAGSRAVGRAPLARGLAGAAEAVLSGLEQVAPGLRWLPAWARTVETTADGHFVVAVGLVDPGGDGHRHGIATGSSPIEAAARATARSFD